MIRYEVGPAPTFFSTAEAREHYVTAKKYYRELSRSRRGHVVGPDVRGPELTNPFSVRQSKNGYGEALTNASIASNKSARWSSIFSDPDW